jgi:aspartate kinase
LDKVIEKQFDAKCLDQNFYDYVSTRIADRIHELPDDCVPVCTGFIGPVPGSLLATIGRGYTDLTAALIAVGLKAEELQIWKEVDGTYITL